MSRKPRRKWPRRRCGANRRDGIRKLEEGFARFHRASRRRPHFSAHLHATGMPGPAAAISRGVVPVRKPFAHDAPAAGRGLRAAFRYFAARRRCAVIEAAAAILLGQMYRRRVPRELRDALSRVRPGACHQAAHRARSPQARTTHPGQSARLGARSGAHVRFAQRGIFRGPSSAAPPRMERSAVALAIRMLRSFARSDCDEQAAGSRRTCRPMRWNSSSIMKCCM